MSNENINEAMVSDTASPATEDVNTENTVTISA